MGVVELLSAIRCLQHTHTFSVKKKNKIKLTTFWPDTNTIHLIVLWKIKPFPLNLSAWLVFDSKMAHLNGSGSILSRLIQPDYLTVTDIFSSGIKIACGRNRGTAIWANSAVKGYFIIIFYFFHSTQGLLSDKSQCVYSVHRNLIQPDYSPESFPYRPWTKSNAIFACRSFYIKYTIWISLSKGTMNISKTENPSQSGNKW